MIIATAGYGLIFALIRWRAGGILGLILVHGLVDFTTTLLIPNIDVIGAASGRPNIPHPLWMVLGLALIIAVPLSLWLVRPVPKRLLPYSQEDPKP